MQRVLEPEVMDTWEEAAEYDAMDFTEVNAAFAQRAAELGPRSGRILDVGTGTARIPIAIAQMCPSWHLTGIDLSKNMLLIGARNVEASGLQARIELELVDAKRLPYEGECFDMVISNSIVHHIPDPLPFFLEVKRVLKPNGALLIRDLIRPIDEAAMDALADRIGAEYNAHQRKLFRDSLNAAFTLDEVKQLVEASGLEGVQVWQSSDRHWSVERTSQER